MNVQLPLGLGLDDHATFDNFHPGRNEAALFSLRVCAEGGDQPLVYVRGAAATGKTHLLQAACQHAAGRGLSVAYLPLRQAREFTVEVLDGMEAMALLCLDDVDAVAGRRDWELALFTLFNRLRDLDRRLVVSAPAGPADIGLQLPDLASRFAWGPVHHLRALTDEDKLRVLSMRARARGLELSADAGGYLLRRYSRDMNTLYALLERLDRASLAAQRKLTVPFIRQTLRERAGG